MLEDDKKKELVEESSSGSQFMDSMTESIGDIVENDDKEETPISELDSDAGSVAPNDLGTETLSDAVSDSASDAASDAVGDAVSDSVVDTVVESASNFIGDVLGGFFDSL